MTVANSPGLVNGWFSLIGESFTGAWQRNITVDGGRSILAFSPVFACATGIAGDFAKLRICLKLLDNNRIGQDVPDGSPLARALSRPNHYQTHIQLKECWALSKLLSGNAFLLKGRDGSGIVDSLYPLEPGRVQPLVTAEGDVYYELKTDNLSGLPKNVTVPAREIIHDRWNCLFHPLQGLSPLYACAMTATQGNRIQQNSAQFFANMSRPSGMLLAPGKIEDADAKRLKAEWEGNFSGGNIGKVAVLGSSMKYEPMATAAADAQLIEQLKWTAEDVARAFHYPLFRLGGAIPVGSTVEALNRMYYDACLQRLIEQAEACLDIGMGGPTGLSAGYYHEFDLDGLLRMDTVARNSALGELVKSGIMSPNEARSEVDLPPVTGGGTPYLQVQNASLAALAARDANSPLPGSPGLPAEPPKKPEPTPAEPAKGMTRAQLVAYTRAKALEFAEAA